MNLQKKIRELLLAAGYELCSLSDKNISFKEKGSDKVGQYPLPLDFSKEWSKNIKINISPDSYYAEVTDKSNEENTFQLSFIKNLMGEDIFSSELFFDGNLYTTFIGEEAGEKISSFRKTNGKNIFTVEYAVGKDSRKLEIKNAILTKVDTKILIIDTINNDKHTSLLVVMQKDKEVYAHELNEREVEEYFSVLAHKGKAVVENVYNRLKTLNSNIVDMINKHYSALSELMNLINSNTESNEVIDKLFEKYINSENFIENSSKKDKTWIKDLQEVAKKLTTEKSRELIEVREEYISAKMKEIEERYYQEEMAALEEEDNESFGFEDDIKMILR